MTKKSKLFSKLVRKWYDKIYLGGWHIELHYFSNKAFAKRARYKKRKAINTVALCYPDWRFLEAFIDVNRDALEYMNDEKIELAVVHELMHVFLNEMHEKGAAHEERIATLLARSFILCGSDERSKE